MIDFRPDQLLRNPALVIPVAPWCDVLENLDLGIILLAQPWLAGMGLRRSDFERQLGQLAASLPIGPLYFQRISRAVASLERRGVLRGAGKGRDRRFVLTPGGFAALIVNLHVLRDDPTLDGREFELKRELVAMWNLTIDRLLTSAAEIALAPETLSFFSQIDRLSIWGRQVITTQVVKDAFNIRRLIALQQENLERLKTQSEARLVETRSQMEFLRGADFTQLDFATLGEHAAILKDNPALLEIIRGIAASAAPQLSVEAQIIRYDAYLTYLDRLKHTYATELKVVDISEFRRRVAGAGD